MSNITTYPQEDNFTTRLASAMSSSDTTLVVNSNVSFTFSDAFYIVVEPGTNNAEPMRVTGVSGTTWTVTRAQERYTGDAGMAIAHPAGSTVIISDNFASWEDIKTAVNTKLDQDGGNTTTTWDLQVSGSNFRFRKDGNDMKFADDNQSEVTLSTLAAAAGTDEKAKVSLDDTTSGFLAAKITGGDGITATETNPGGNETLDLDVDTTDTTVFVKTSSGAGDEDKVPVLDATGKLAAGFQTGISETLFDAKGDILAASADDTAARLAVGTTHQRLIPDTAESTGLRWDEFMAADEIATINNSATGDANVDTQITIGFQPKLIILKYALLGVTGGNNPYSVGMAVYDGTTLKFNCSTFAEIDAAASPTAGDMVNANLTTAPTAGTDGAAQVKVSTTMNAVDATSFTIRTAFERTSGSTAGQARYSYIAFG